MFVGKMYLSVSRPMKIVTFDFPQERDSFRNKIMDIVEDLSEKNYNNNGKPCKPSRILRSNLQRFAFFIFCIFSNLPCFSSFFLFFFLSIFLFFFHGFLEFCSLLSFFIFSSSFSLSFFFFFPVVRADAKTRKKSSNSSCCKNDDVLFFENSMFGPRWTRVEEWPI